MGVGTIIISHTSLKQELSCVMSCLGAGVQYPEDQDDVLLLLCIILVRIITSSIIIFYVSPGQDLIVWSCFLRFGISIVNEIREIYMFLFFNNKIVLQGVNRMKWIILTISEYTH